MKESMLCLKFINQKLLFRAHFLYFERQMNELSWIHKNSKELLVVTKNVQNICNWKMSGILDFRIPPVRSSVISNFAQKQHNLFINGFSVENINQFFLECVYIFSDISIFVLNNLWWHMFAVSWNEKLDTGCWGWNPKQTLILP